ncbi:MAG: SGNH/GDSL hydrolase family protein [Bacteroidaceae bacterium]|nr:SGNH/GDSL hydrolase family protein [Bacteroidaceae bacterium]
MLTHKIIYPLLLSTSTSLFAQSHATVVYRQGETPQAIPVNQIDSITLQDISKVNADYFEAKKDTVYVAPLVQSHWKGKRIGFLGDSITQYGEYVDAYAALTGCEAMNYGISATHIARANGSTANAFESRYSRMSIGLDMVIVFGGTNDFGHKATAAFGEFSDGTKSGRYTFYAGLHRLMSGLVKRYAGKPIVIMTPIHHGVEIDEPEYILASDGSITEGTNSTTGKTFREYVNAIKEVAAYYSLPVIDAYSYSGLSPMTEVGSANRVYFKDGLHLSKKGGERLARWMYPQLEQIYDEYYK